MFKRLIVQKLKIINDFNIFKNRFFKMLQAYKLKFLEKKSSKFIQKS